MTRLLNIRLRILAVALALALALPSAVLGTDAGGSTTETINGPAQTISITVPATVAYTRNGALFDSANINVNNLTTNNLTGLTVRMTASAFTGAGTVPTTVRSRDAISCSLDGMSGGTARPTGFYDTSTTVDEQCKGAAALTGSGRTYSVTMHATSSAFSIVNGVYTGTLSFIASTNP